MRIYADFNGWLTGLEPEHKAVCLEGFGTLRDLNAHHLKLYDGLELTLWSDSSDDEIMETRARVYWFADTRKTRGGQWLADIDPQAVRYLSANPGDLAANRFLCSNCEIDLTETLDRSAIPPAGECPACRTPMGEALAPPSEHT